MLRPGGRIISILTVVADGDMKRDQQEAELLGCRKVVSVINLERARDSMSQITRLLDGGLIHVPPLRVLSLEDAALAHEIIDTGRVRGKLVLEVSPLSAESRRG